MRHERVLPAPDAAAPAHPDFEDIYAELDAGTKLPWFCAHVKNDLS